MTYRVIYNDEYKRVIPAILIDSRALAPSIVTATGFEVLAYTNSVADLVTSSVLPYKIETNEGVLSGYFNLTVIESPKSVTLLNKQLRPAFQKYDTDISQVISNFIISGNWQNDYLF